VLYNKLAVSLQLESIRKLLEVEFEWLLPGTHSSKYIPEMEYKLANFNWICNPFLLHITFIYSMLFNYLFFY